MNRNKKAIQIGSILLIGVMVVLIAACTVRRAPGGGIQVTPDLGDNPGYGGVWRKRTIDGKCMWTNGTYCLPCDSSPSEIVPCSEILQKVQAFEEAMTTLGHEIQFINYESMQDVFYILTGGLTGPQWLSVSGWINWEEDDVIDEVPLRVNLFDDNDTPNNEADDHLDVTILWYTAWSLPDLGDLPGDAEVHAYFDGNGYDDEHDMMALRVVGPSLDVQAALENLLAPGTCFTLSIPSEGFQQVICRP